MATVSCANGWTGADYKQQGIMLAQHNAPATQQDAANAVAEKAEAPTAAATLMQIVFMKFLPRLSYAFAFETTFLLTEIAHWGLKG